MEKAVGMTPEWRQHQEEEEIDAGGTGDVILADHFSHVVGFMERLGLRWRHVPEAVCSGICRDAS